LDIAGYTSIWVLAFVGAALVFLPAGALALACVAVSPAVGLNPLLVGVIAGSAEALGELTGYAAGRGGKSFFRRNKFYLRFKNLFEQYGGIILFFGSIIPNPVFDVLGVAAGSTLYPVKRFLLIVFAGKTIKFTWIAMSCYWGLNTFT
jgi:membrane protein YqaA with SNARE-associated domain